MICEGPIDTAAGLDIGFAAVGRPHSDAGTEVLIRLGVGRNVVIFGNRDPASRTEAEGLAMELKLHRASVRIIHPPDEMKDLRAWMVAGLSYAELEAKIEATEPIHFGKPAGQKQHTPVRLPGSS